VRRVLSVEQKEGGLVLSVQRFGQAKSSRLGVDERWRDRVRVVFRKRNQLAASATLR
jgi:hypothetical protein